MSASGAVAPRSQLLQRLDAERVFFGAMALLIVLLILAGFAPTFFLRGLFTPRRPLVPLTPLVVVHGLVCTVWVAVFVVQTALIAAGRRRLHKRVGLASAALAVAMVGLSAATALAQAVRGSGPPGLPPLVWLAVPLGDVPTLAGLLTAGYALRRHPAAHKRLMLLAAVLLLQPAVGRLPLPRDVLGGELAALLAWVMALPLVAWDVRSRGRVHAATAIGVTALAAEQLLRIATWRTDAWEALASRLLGLWA